MPLDLDCPKCRHVFPVTEARHPVGVECPACAAELTAEFRRLPVPTPGQPHYELLVSPGRPPGSAPPPAAGKPLKLDDDEEDGGKRRKGGSMLVVVLAGLGALAVTVGGLGAVGYVLFTNLDVPEKTSATKSGGGTTRPAGGNNNPGRTPDPARPDPFVPRPGEFVSHEWGFAAKFPADPKTRRQQTGGMSLTAFVADGKDGACMVLVGDVPGIGDDVPAAQARTLLIGVQDGMVNGAGGKLKDARDVRLAGTHPGREYTAATTKPAAGQQRGRVYLVGKRLYQVVAMGSNQYAGSPEVKAFLDSFRLAE